MSGDKKTKNPEMVSGQLFQHVLDTMTDMVMVKGENSRLIWVNKAFQDFYGMTNEQLRGLIDSPNNEPDYTQQYIRDDLKVFQTKQTLDIPHDPVIRHDGALRVFHTVKSPLINEKNEVEMLVGLSRDVTDRLQAEQILSQEREKHLAASKLAALGEMAGGIAHEINNPLAILKTLSGQIKELLAEEQPDLQAVVERLDVIEETTDRIATVVRGMKSISRDGHGDPKIKINISDVVKETVAFGQQRFKEAGIDLQLPDPSPLEVQGRAVEISQILLNLLNNAFDSICGQSHLQEPWVKLKLWEENNFVFLSVTDSGTAIPSTLAGKLFQPFFTTKEVGKGTGLGLSVSRKIAQSHEGDLYLDSKNKNVCFILKLPRKQA